MKWVCKRKHDIEFRHGLADPKEQPGHVFSLSRRSLSIQLSENILRTLWEGSFNIMNKRSSSNFNRMLVQIDLIFGHILNMQNK